MLLENNGLLFGPGLALDSVDGVAHTPRSVVQILSPRPFASCIAETLRLPRFSKHNFELCDAVSHPAPIKRIIRLAPAQSPKRDFGFGEIAECIGSVVEDL